MGFKSVAHFLIQTKRSQPSSGQNPTDLASAKRSLSFIDFDVNPAGTMEHHVENNVGGESENEKQILQSISNVDTKDHISVKRSLSFSCLEQQDLQETKPPYYLDHENDELSKLQSASYELGDVINEKEKEPHCLKRKNGDNYSPSDECPMPEKKPTIALRNDQSDKELLGVQGITSPTDQSLEKKGDISSQTTSETTTGQKSPEGKVFQETNEEKTSEEGANSLSKKKTKPRVELSISSELKSVSTGRVLRSGARHQSPETKTDISSQTTSDSTTEQQNPDGVFQEADDKPSIIEGSNSLSRKNTKAEAELSTSSEPKSVSIGRVLRPRHKTI